MGFMDVLKLVGDSIKNLNISFDTDGSSRTIKASLSERQTGVGANINIVKTPDTKSQVNVSICKSNEEIAPDPIIEAKYAE